MKKIFKNFFAVSAITAVSFTASARTSYRGFVDFDPTVSITYGSVSPSELSLYDKPTCFTGLLSTTHGMQINRHLFVGVGVGILFDNLKSKNASGLPDDDQQRSTLDFLFPAFLTVRYDLNVARKISPFVSFKIGYISRLTDEAVFGTSFSNSDYWDVELKSDSGIWFQPTIGVRFRLGHHNGLNLGLTMMPTHYKTDSRSHYDSLTEATFSRYNLGLNIGIDF